MAAFEDGVWEFFEKTGCLIFCGLLYIIFAKKQAFFPVIPAFFSGSAGPLFHLLFTRTVLC
jgi:hypothetical protein